MNVLEKLDALLNGPTAPVNGPPPRKTVPIQFPEPHQPTPTGPAVERAVFVPDGVNPGYEGASQAGTLDAPELREPLTPEAQAELRPKIRPALPADALAGTQHAAAPQIKAYDSRLRGEGYRPPRSVLEQLSAKDVPWVRLQNAITEAAKSQGDAYHRHMQDIARRTADGDDTVKREDSWSRADWDADARERIGAFKLECKRIEAEAWTLAEPALFEKADACDRLADKLEEEARQPFEEFAVAFSPPLYVLILRKYAASLRDGSRRNVGLPSAMIETL